MRSAFKVLAWFIAIIVFLYIILTLVLHHVINPKTYKSLVENTVYKFTGHQMVINGDFKWSVFPNPSVKITDVLIENQKGSEHVSPYFAKVKEADMQISLLPLFSGQIVPKTIILRGANINLVYQSAKNNPITKTTTKVEQAQKSNDENPMLAMRAGKKSLKLNDDDTSRATYLKHTQLPNVTILNTNVNWIDLKENKITNFKDVNLTIHPQNNSALIKGAMTIIHNKQVIKLNLDTILASNLAHNQFTFKNLTFNGTASANNTLNKLNYSGPVDINLIKQTVSIPTYKLSWNNLPMTGKIMGNWDTTNNGLSAQFTASTHVAGGLINEKGQFNAPDKSHDSIHYLLSIHNINLAQILKALHYDHLLKGTGNLTATLNASNNNQNWVSNLNGDGNFKLTDTELGQLNSSNYLNQAMQVIHGKKVQNNGITVFSNISGSFKIHDGVFYNDDLKMNAKQITATGSGNINFNSHIINYHVFLEHNDNKGYTIPLDISGDLHKPKVKVDLASLGKNVIQKSVKKNLFKNLFHDKHIDIKKIF